jgi:hypothetical protein
MIGTVLPPDPTTAEWVAAGVAAGLVAVLGGAHLVRPALVRSPASMWGRAAALLLGTATAGVIVALAVVFAAGMRADGIDLAAGTGYPEGPFAGVIVTANVAAADDVAAYAAALLLPLGATLGVLAVAVAATTARAGLRIAAGIACVIGVLACLVLAMFDTGAVVAGVAVAGLALFAAAAACLAADALRFRT